MAEDAKAEKGEALLEAARQAAEEGWRWYVAKTQPRKEVLAKQHLDRQGFETFLPFAPDKLRSKKSRAAKLRQPLFPGYIFVRLNLKTQRWRAVNSTIGVLYLVQFGERPSPMPVGATEDLIGRTGDTGILSFELKLKVGEPVRVIGGPMDDFVGELQRLDGAGRGLVLLELMNRKVSVIVPQGNLLSVAGKGRKA